MNKHTITQIMGMIQLRQNMYAVSEVINNMSNDDNENSK